MTRKSKRGSKNSQEENRLAVIDYLNEKRGTPTQAASAIGISKSAVYNIWKQYQAGGHYWNEKNRGNKNWEGLGRIKEDEIKGIIEEGAPKRPDRSFGVWTTDDVSKLIKKKHRELSRWQVARYLISWGYASQISISDACSQKSEKANKWFEEQYPAIKNEAKSEGAIIYYGDETGLRKFYRINEEGKKIKCRMISAKSNKGHLQFIITKGRANSKILFTFLSRMNKHSKRKIYFITDNYLKYKTKDLDRWLSVNKRIRVFFLPTK